jgi:outer membrane protein assembly factor BamE (lipoprotein component of BamABCDE complex)
MVKIGISILHKMQVYIKIFILLLLTACLREKQDGFIFEEETLAKIRLSQTKEEVISIIGTPSFELKNDTLVYSSVTKEFRAFFHPKVKSQTVIELQFANNKLVKIAKHTKLEEINYRDIQTKIEVKKKPQI